MLCISCMIINRAMLKMTQSFCRYTRFTCENINYKKIHVKSYTHLTSRRKTCVTNNTQNSIANEYSPTHQQLRLLGNIKKRFRLKRPQISSIIARATKPMNNRLLPSVVYVSPGGDPNPEDEAMPCEDAHPSTSSTYHPINKRRDKIPANFRRWESKNMKTDGSFSFRVVSYNVLAQYLLECHPYLYKECDPEDLQWNVRSERIFKEIMDLDPDILCLQEVQATHIKSFYVKFEQNGYYGIFKQKTGHREDGCAIYFKKDLFDLEEHQSVEFYQPDIPLLNRDNVGLMMKLVPRMCPHVPLVVATTHLLYNPMRTDVRLAQMQIMLAELDRFAYFNERGEGKNTGYYPIILTGDFNSTPDSLLIRLLATGRASPTVASLYNRDRVDWRRVAVTDQCQHLSVHLNRTRNVHTDFSAVRIFNSEVNEEPMMFLPGEAPPPRDPDPEVMRHSNLFNTAILTHPFKFSSVYSNIKRGMSSPTHPKCHEATTFQDYWITVDYMFYSSCNKLRLLERFRLPTTLECQVLGSLPNDVYGSDHLVLAARFEITDNTAAY